jgi:hypothetical protein
MIAWRTVTVVAALSALAIMAARAQMQSPRTRAPANGALFLAIAPVLQHPRCMNCHTQVDAPRQGDDQHRHIINVRRGADGHGAAALRCTACHGRSNNAASGVPGADEDWHLAPLSMGWEGLGVAEICRHLIDPARNGGRTGQQVIDHLTTNLVRWAWSPGVTAHGIARTSPPLSHADFVAAAQVWIDAGAPCP